MNKILVLLASIAFGTAWAGEPAGYYNTANGLTGTALRTALHNIIKGHTVIRYTATRTPLELLDQDPANSSNLILIYERTTWRKADFVSPALPNGWNREHCWPNSLGIDSVEPAYSDLFNLRACGEPANSDRANLYYDESTTTAGGYQIPSGPTSPLCSQDFDSWEPPAEVKGDLARAMFYMDVRYEGGGEPDLILTENIALISSAANYMGRLSTLLIWNFLDPVSPAERTRAEGAFGYQHNRNPFVDHPEWVEAVYGEVFKLTAAFTATAVTLSWPALLPADLGFIETSTDLITWIPAALTITDSGGKHTATVPLGSTQRFYRLKLQARAG